MTVPANKTEYAAWIKQVKALRDDVKQRLQLNRFALSTRAHSAFRRARLETLGDLMVYTEEGVGRMHLVGVKTQKEIVAFLASVGIKLRTDQELLQLQRQGAKL